MGSGAAYLDHAAGSPLRPEALAALVAAHASPGNPSSTHGHGQAARRSLEEAREAIARRLGCEPIELVLTSGGTESANLAIRGGYRARQRERARPRVVAPAGEHHATIDALAALEREARAELVIVPVDGEGVVDLGAFEAAIGDGAEVALATTLLASNEIGTVQPVRAMSAIARAVGVPIHVDAVAALGRIPVDAGELGADLLSVSAHKVGGPVGVGALVARRAAALEPILHGGGQQRGLRPGTMDVAGAAGFAAAIEAACEPAALVREAARLDALAGRLLEGLERIDGVRLRGPRPEAELVDAGTRVRARVPGSLDVTVEGCQGDSLLLLLDHAGVSVSNGSACQAGVAEPSHVLLALGLDERTALSALRTTLGWSSTDEDVDRLLAAMPGAVSAARRAGFA